MATLDELNAKLDLIVSMLQPQQISAEPTGVELYQLRKTIAADLAMVRARKEIKRSART